MTPTLLTLAILTAASGAAAIACELTGRRRGLYVFKPLTMAFVLATFAAGGGAVSPGRYLVGAALVASLVGDVFLMFPDRHFVAGLVSFLVAHVFYIAAFGMRVAAVNGAARHGVLWVPLAVLATYAVVMFRYLRPKLGALEVPVGVYVGVITLMGWLAAAAFALSGDARSATTFAGAVLFMASDSLLAVNRFRRPFRGAEGYILATYFAGQWLIAASA
jgi:uncharacterized membrane protein YhhN